MRRATTSTLALERHHDETRGPAGQVNCATADRTTNIVRMLLVIGGQQQQARAESAGRNLSLTSLAVAASGRKSRDHEGQHQAAARETLIRRPL